MPCIMPKPNYIHVINFIKGMQHMTVKAKTKHIIYSEVHIHWETKVSKPPLHIFNGLISRRPAVIGVHWYMLSILLSNQNVFMFNVCGSDRAIRDPIKPELWDLLFALQSSPNCPKTAGNTCLLYRSFSSTAYWGNTHLSYKTQMFTETDRSYIWGQALKLHQIQIRNTLYCTKAEPCRLLIAVSARGNQGGGWRQLFALRWIIDGKTASDRPLYFWIFFQPYFFIIQYLDFLPPYFIHSGFSCNSLKGEWSLQGWWWCFSWERRRAEMTNGSWGWWAVRD